MKLIKLSTLVTTIIFTATAFAGREGGGGGIYKPSPTIVKSTLDAAINPNPKFDDQFKSIVVWFQILGHSRELIQNSNPEILKLLNSMLPPAENNSPASFPVIENIKDMKLDVRENRDCDGEGDHKFGSVPSFTLTAPVCMSISRWTTVPKSSLEKEMIGVLAHEIAHKFGANEKAAEEFQIFFLEEAANIVKYRLLMGDIGTGTLSLIPLYLSEAALQGSPYTGLSIDKTGRLKNQSELCADFGKVFGLYSKLNFISGSIKYGSLNTLVNITPEAEKRIQDSMLKSQTLTDKCQISSWQTADKIEVRNLQSELTKNAYSLYNFFMNLKK